MYNNGGDFKINSVEFISSSVTGVTLSADTLELDVKPGSITTTTAQLTATVEPTTADKSVTWSSTNPAVASVDQSGKVTAHSIGTTIIRATSILNSMFSDECTVTVIDSTPESRKIAYIVTHGKDDQLYWPVNAYLPMHSASVVSQEDKTPEVTTVSSASTEPAKTTAATNTTAESTTKSSQTTTAEHSEAATTSREASVSTSATTTTQRPAVTTTQRPEVTEPSYTFVTPNTTTSTAATEPDHDVTRPTDTSSEQTTTTTNTVTEATTTSESATRPTTTTHPEDSGWTPVV